MMGAELHTFCDIFKSVNAIVIPQIQRDYAQGRDDKQVERIREKFLSALFDAVQGEPITLDFVYGDKDEYGVMTPLDGQQRLTTLYLLHIYAVKKQKIVDTECGFLKNFSYRTRFSARDFCAELVEFDPDLTKKYSEEVRNQSWFAEEWNNDPTVAGMLKMLDCIQEEDNKRQVENLWEKLKGGAVKFYFLSIDNMGLTDELYIKMNSRGKPLTAFEHFKAEFVRVLREAGDKLYGNENEFSKIIYKTDGAWTEFLWQFRKTDGDADENVAEQIDLAFMNYFRFTVDLIRYKNGEFTRIEDDGDYNDEFNLLKKYFSGDCEKAEENIRFLEQNFDIWRGVDVEDLFSVFSENHRAGKVLYGGMPDLLLDCLENYADFSDGGVRERNFTYGKTVLLLCFLTYLKAGGAVSRETFVRRLRVVNNLVQNSTNELAERSNDNHMPAIIAFTESFIKTGSFDGSEKTFNAHQLKEEREKLVWTEQNPQFAEELFALEDHPLLYGQIGIVGLNPDLFARFASLFSCKRAKVNRALIATGDFRQYESGCRYRTGGAEWSDVWKTLFHNTGAWGYAETAKTLRTLLEKHQDFTDEILDEIADGFLADCGNRGAYIWRYYFVKYPSAFLPERYGKYVWRDMNKPYESTVLHGTTHRSEKSYNPYLKAVGKGTLSNNPYDEYLLLNGVYIRGNNQDFTISDADNELLDTVDVPLDNGVDKEDRVQLIINSLRDKGLWQN